MAKTTKDFAIDKTSFASQAIDQASKALGDQAPQSLSQAQASLDALANDLQQTKLH